MSAKTFWMPTAGFLVLLLVLCFPSVRADVCIDPLCMDVAGERFVVTTVGEALQDTDDMTWEYDPVAQTITPTLGIEVHDEVTLHQTATDGGLSIDGQEISFQAATAEQSGYLTSTDWSTFSGKSDVADLPDLGDVTLGVLSAGDVLTYDDGTGEWINQALPAAPDPDRLVTATPSSVVLTDDSTDQTLTGNTGNLNIVADGDVVIPSDTLRGPRTGCTTGTELFLDGAPAAGYTDDFLGACATPGDTVLYAATDAFFGGPVASICSSGPATDIIATLSFGTDDLRLCSWNIPGFGIAFSFIIPSSDTCQNLIDAIMTAFAQPTPGPAADIDDAAWFTYNATTCTYDFTGTGGTIPATWNDPPTVTTDSAIAYAWSVDTAGDAVVGTLDVARGIGVGEGEWGYPQVTPHLNQAGAWVHKVYKDIIPDYYDGTSGGGTNYYRSGLTFMNEGWPNCGGVVDCPIMYGIRGVSVTRGSGDIGLIFGALVQSMSGGSGNVDNLTGVLSQVGTETAGASAGSVIAYNILAPSVGPVDSFVGLNVPDLSGGTGPNVGVEIDTFSDPADFGIRSGTRINVTDDVPVTFGTDEDIALSSSTADQLDLTPAVANGDVTLNVVGTGALVLGSDVDVTGDLSLPDDKKLILGTDDDAEIYYDETTTDSLIITGAPVRIGDASNYVAIATDGELTLVGTARVWKSHDLNPQNVGKPSANPPAAGERAGFVFDRFDSATEEQVYYHWNIPDDYAEGTASIRGHFGLMVENPPVAPAGDEVVVMGFEYKKISAGDIFAFTAGGETSGTISVTIAEDEAAWTWHISSTGVMDTTGFARGDLVLFRFYRDATNANDTYDNGVGAANDAWVGLYQLEYLSDRIGEAS